MCARGLIPRGAYPWRAHSTEEELREDRGVARSFRRRSSLREVSCNGPQPAAAGHRLPASATSVAISRRVRGAQPQADEPCLLPPLAPRLRASTLHERVASRLTDASCGSVASC